MSTIHRCDDCGKLFGFLPRNLCGECLAHREELFLTVRSYFRDHPAAPVADVAHATDVPVEMIVGWIDEGRLSRRAPDDQTLSAVRAEEERRESIRRSLAETVAARPPEPPAPERTRPHGMFGRQH